MPVIRKTFGRLNDGRNVDSLVLMQPRGDFSVEILEYGATIRAIHVPNAGGCMMNAVLSYDTLGDYEAGNLYLGATIGRCAGRIDAHAHATLRLTCNESCNHLHGGEIGFSHSLWETVAVEDRGVPRVQLRHRSPAGEDGYPGAVTVDAEFALVDDFVLRATLQARSDADTPLNLTLHPYFNLNGGPGSTIANHRLRINAAEMLPLDAKCLPTGEVVSVARTPFDFRRAREIGRALDDANAQLRIAGGYDHYFVLDGNGGAAADVFSPRSSLGVRIETNQKGMQFYSGNRLADGTPLRFPARSALCLEPHAFPNAINEPGFPDITLRAGDVYRHETTYAFYHGAT
jgi:aldose 1-epimerase